MKELYFYRVVIGMLLLAGAFVAGQLHATGQLFDWRVGSWLTPKRVVATDLPPRLNTIQPTPANVGRLTAPIVPPRNSQPVLTRPSSVPAYLPPISQPVNHWHNQPQAINLAAPTRNPPARLSPIQPNPANHAVVDEIVDIQRQMGGSRVAEILGADSAESFKVVLRRMVDSGQPNNDAPHSKPAQPAMTNPLATQLKQTAAQLRQFAGSQGLGEVEAHKLARTLESLSSRLK